MDKFKEKSTKRNKNGYQEVKTTIMKLELKHLAPYLPYGLNIARNTSLTLTRESWNKDRVLTAGHLDFNHYEIDEVFKGKNVHGQGLKAILRPINYLTEEEYSEQFYNILVGEAPNYGGEDAFEATIEQFANLNAESFMSCKLPYDCFEFMFENHFDVFGLIDKGLAIDINTIE